MTRESRTASRARCAATLLVVSTLLAACGGPDGPRLSDAAERGRGTFAAFCAACHNYRNPFADGQTGPAIARSSLDLLQRKVLFGKYSGTEVKLDGDEVVVMREDDIMAVLEG